MSMLMTLAGRIKNTRLVRALKPPHLVCCLALSVHISQSLPLIAAAACSCDKNVSDAVGSRREAARVVRQVSESLRGLQLVWCCSGGHTRHPHQDELDQHANTVACHKSSPTVKVASLPFCYTNRHCFCNSKHRLRATQCTSLRLRGPKSEPARVIA
jgi:hypothetical protein